MVYVSEWIHCGLSMVPWLFTKAKRPVLVHLFGKGHRVLEYLERIVGAASTPRTDHRAGRTDTMEAETEVRTLLSLIGMYIHPTKIDLQSAMSL